MRVVAMYLPQFHQVPENDIWWGEGFTEWNTVKAAVPLFDGHDQPRIPLDGRYYNLLSKETMIWQTDLMRRYGIDGICMYHYWFQNGRRVLEKPERNLLKWKDVDLPYCFCWANETWARSWSNVKTKNSWASTFEDGSDRAKDNNGILLLQDYGDREQWEKHFDYLLPFFKDERYIRIDGRPVFVIYITSLVPCAEEMFGLWRNLAKANGLKDLYIIGGNCDRDMGGVVDGQLYHEPQLSVRTIRQWNPESQAPSRIRAGDVWNHLLRKEREYAMQPYFGGFVGYDDTPRQGAEGIVITDNAPDLFCRSLTKLLRKNESYNAEITFLNAWNEWGEGMYLEPDERNGYAFLEAVSKAKENFRETKRDPETKSEARIESTESIDSRKAEIFCKRVEKNLHVMDQWLYLMETGVSLTDFIREKFGSFVAVYGYGILGKHLCRELVMGGVDIAYIVERNVESVHLSIPAYRPEGDFLDCDALIVTAPYYFEEIKAVMRGKGIKNIVSIGDIINELAQKKGI